MLYFLIGFLSTVLGGVFMALLLELPHRKRHRDFEKAIAECSRYTDLAQKAKTGEEYEFYMKKAVYHIDRAGEIRKSNET